MKQPDIASPQIHRLLRSSAVNENQSDHRPEIFRPVRREDSDRLADLLNANPEIVVFDQLASQLAALIETRAPAETIVKEDLECRVTKHLAGRSEQEYGVWVYYPWSRRLVHILDEDEFVELRTSRNRYKITQDEQNRLAGKSVGVVGLSVGQSVALTMGIERSYGEIRLADFDTLELTNLNRLRSGLHNLGVSKVIIAAREISEIDPFMQVRCFSEGLTEDNLDRFLLEGGQLSLLIEECDGLDMKFLCRKRARELRIPVVMDTSDRGMIDVERFDLEPDRPSFHGLVNEPPLSELKQLSTEDKVPFVLSILGQDTLSTRLRASMLEVSHSIPTWPQLATSVALGGAVTGDVCRRILLGSFRSSGRFYVDVEQLIGDEDHAHSDVEPSPYITTPKTSDDSEPLTLQQMERLADESIPRIPGSKLRLETDTLTELVRSANLAPSGGNVQPWRWLYRTDRLLLFHDKQRSESLLDFEDRASYMALGAATENLVLEAHRQGLDVVTTQFPNPSNNRFVASFAFHPNNSGDLAHPTELHVCDDLVEYVSVRLTNRQLGPREQIQASKLDALSQSARTVAGANLILVDSHDELTEIGEIIGESDRLRILHRRGHADFVNEIRWTSAEARRTCDGIDLDTVDLTSAERSGLQMARDWRVVQKIGNWNGGKGFETLSRKSVAAASAIGLLRMPITDATTFFDAGRLVERVWLEASRQNLAFQPLSGLLFLFARMFAGETLSSADGILLSSEMRHELPLLHERFVKLFPSDENQTDIFLFRLSQAAAPSVRSVRRPVEDVLSISTS